MDEQTMQQEITNLDEAISRQLKVLAGKFTARHSINELAEELAKVRELLETRSQKVDLLNNLRA